MWTGLFFCNENTILLMYLPLENRWSLYLITCRYNNLVWRALDVFVPKHQVCSNHMGGFCVTSYQPLQLQYGWFLRTKVSLWLWFSQCCSLCMCYIDFYASWLHFSLSHHEGKIEEKNKDADHVMMLCIWFELDLVIALHLFMFDDFTISLH
jgi:hypothetical protein